MERELLLTGIGGQGVQLGAQVLARAATLDGREVSLFGLYGGAMRGGNTESTLVVADAPIDAPPIVSRAGSAIAMHHRYWPAVVSKLRPGAVIVLNATLFEGEVDRAEHRVFDVPASRIAADLGSDLAASMVMVGAYVALTDLVSLDALIAGMEASVPAYRRQHIAANEQAIRAGFAAAPRGAAPAWEA